MDPDHLLALLEPMLANFKRELEELRAAGATQSDVERMLDDFEERYAEDEEYACGGDSKAGCTTTQLVDARPTECGMPEGEAPGSNEVDNKRAPAEADAT